ncbi:MAG: hypothetical protein WCL32_04890 [Planctomycetota bacterium]
MASFPASLLKHASRIFLDFAYPAGHATLPPAASEFERHCEEGMDLPPRAQSIVRVLEGDHPGFSVRLGCAAFPYLRLTCQQIGRDGVLAWLCSVDTHDSWHHPDHADAAGWLAVQAANRELKARIEKAWDEAGILTHNRLLRQELQPTHEIGSCVEASRRACPGGINP